MKKKYRNITVDGVEYAWKIYLDDGCKFIRIWEDKKIIHDGFVSDYTEEETITPIIIKNIIKNVLHSPR